MLTEIGCIGFKIERGRQTGGKGNVDTYAGCGIEPRFDHAVGGFGVDFAAPVLKHGLQRKVALHTGTATRGTEARAEAETEGFLSFVVVKNKTFPVYPGVEGEGAGVPQHLYAGFGVGTEVEFVVVEWGYQAVVRLAMQGTDQHVEVVGQLHLYAEYGYGVKAVLSAFTLPAGQTAIIKVGVFACSPKVEQVGTQVDFKIAQRLIRYHGVEPDAGQRVAFNQFALVLVVAQKGHGFDAYAQFAFGCGVDGEWLYAVDE